MTAGTALQPSAVALTLPFAGRWLVQNSPARRVPSHGSDLFGERYAIDFVAVDERRRSSAVRDVRTVFGTEPPGRFVGFGRPILAPARGRVVGVHDGEPDHAARRSQPALLGYALGQAARLRAGVPAIAGNHVILRLDDDGSDGGRNGAADGGAFVALVHLRQGSLRVSPGQDVPAGEQLGECGNSGNSTEPHLHLQAMDSADLAVARGIPIAFRSYREWAGRAGPVDREVGVPGEGSIVEALPVSGSRA